MHPVLVDILITLLNQVGEGVLIEQLSVMWSLIPLMPAFSSLKLLSFYHVLPVLIYVVLTQELTDTKAKEPRHKIIEHVKWQMVFWANTSCLHRAHFCSTHSKRDEAE